MFMPSFMTYLKIGLILSFALGEPIIIFLDMSRCQITLLKMSNVCIGFSNV